MPNISYKILERRQKMHIKAYAILCTAMLIAVGTFSYLKWSEYTFVNALLTNSGDLITTLKEGVSSASSSYETEKKNFDDMQKEIENKLKNIFPEGDNYTALTRQLDVYEEELSGKDNPFEVSNIDYDEIVDTEVYSILPLKMNIRSSSENFQKFLHMMENSGSLDEELRLMDISSIRLSFEGGGEEEDAPAMINFNVQINAYFQKKK